MRELFDGLGSIDVGIGGLGVLVCSHLTVPREASIACSNASRLPNTDDCKLHGDLARLESFNQGRIVI